MANFTLETLRDAASDADSMKDVLETFIDAVDSYEYAFERGREEMEDIDRDDAEEDLRRAMDDVESWFPSLLPNNGIEF